MHRRAIRRFSSSSPPAATRWLDEASSPPLHGQQGRPRLQASTVLPVGSLLVLYSDGLIERRSARLADGLDRLAREASLLVNASTAEVCDALVTALGVDTSRTDDVALLAVRLDTAPIARFRRAFPARPEELRELRREMRVWMQERQVDEPRRNALLLAVGEACSNAVEHAYAGRVRGDVTVEILEHDDRSLSVHVRDFGGFTSPEGPFGHASDRGRGTMIMRALTSDFFRASTTNGTAVRFRLPMHEMAPA